MGRPAPIFLASRGHRAPSPPLRPILRRSPPPPSLPPPPPLIPPRIPPRGSSLFSLLLFSFLFFPLPTRARGGVRNPPRCFSKRFGSRTAKRGLHNYSGRASPVFLGQWDCGSMGQWTGVPIEATPRDPDSHITVLETSSAVRMNPGCGRGKKVERRVGEEEGGRRGGGGEEEEEERERRRTTGEQKDEEDTGGHRSYYRFLITPRRGVAQVFEIRLRHTGRHRRCVYIYIYILALPIRCNYVRRVAASSIVRFHRSSKVAREGALPEKKIRGVYDFKTRRNFLQIPRGSKKKKTSRIPVNVIERLLLGFILGKRENRYV